MRRFEQHWLSITSPARCTKERESCLIGGRKSPEAVTQTPAKRPISWDMANRLFQANEPIGHDGDESHRRLFVVIDRSTLTVISVMY